MLELPDIKSFTLERLQSFLLEHGYEQYRAKQIFRWLYIRQADNFSVMTDISKTLRPFLSENFSINRLKKVRSINSSDSTIKYLFCLKDGNYIESVLIPEKNHYTLCISTQVGCSLGCSFCLTGKMGFIRNLYAEEIIAQVRDVMHEVIFMHDSSKKLTNVVLMGMGEPLLNYSNVLEALNIITNGDYGMGVSPRKITLSTAGIVPGLYKLGKESNVKLAISLNASNNKIRNYLMPINKKYPIEILLRALKEYPLTPRKRITFEYILIKGVNDSLKDAYELVNILNGIKSKINLIPFNAHAKCEFKRPDESVILNFQKILINNNYTAIIRRSKGEDIMAACGQLNSNESKCLEENN